ncbi:MAG TPA: 16S rRNA (cytosine(1402)-N(4))-methyltransferase, partial [Verrucomicrobiae bacterium]|nr:16S rRNA (cytosine(1402)-N(4))-methyltransferase [Verrucomicrobiae bacterium]
MPPFVHKSVLLREVLEALQPDTGQLYVDGTVGGGGHASALLQAARPAARLVGLDRDEMALSAAAEKLSAFQGRFELHHANYAEIERFVQQA